MLPHPAYNLVLESIVAADLLAADDARYQTVLPPPPAEPHDSLAPVAPVELRAEPPAPRKSSVGMILGVAAAVAMMALGLGLRHQEPAASAAPAAAPMPVIVLPEILIVGDLHAGADMPASDE